MSRHSDQSITITRCVLDASNKLHEVGTIEVAVWGTSFSQCGSFTMCKSGGNWFPIAEHIRVVQQRLEASAR